MRILVGADYTLASPVFVGSDGETATDAASLPTCTVTRADGTVLAAPTVADAAGLGRYTATLTAATHTNLLDKLSVVWTGTVTGAGVQRYTDGVDVVGAHYVSLAALRAYQDLSDPVKYPAALLQATRDDYAALVERICGVSFVPRYHYESLHGNSRQMLRLSKQRASAVRSVTVNGIVKSPSLFGLSDTGALVYLRNAFPQSLDGAPNVIVGYEHGHVCPPASLSREMLKAVRSEVMAQRSQIRDNALSQTFDGMTIRFSTPDPKNGRPTGILTLDPVLVEYDETMPGIG